LIDGSHVIIGDFNFTRAAQHRNAENILLIEFNAARETQVSGHQD
jgi:phosphatidylserine/phosphatidylglycerophosphate/cardiolipin synthase-like enzyme